MISFKGRISRKDFWLEYLFLIFASFTVALLLALVGVNPEEDSLAAKAQSFILVLVVTIPSLSLCARRLHDNNKSGWYQLVWILGIWTSVLLGFLLLNINPALGYFVGIGLFLAVTLHSFHFLGLKKGDDGANHYGEPRSSAVFE